MNLTNTMICWDMGGNVALVPWPDRRGASDKFQRSTGACYDVVRGGDFEQRKCRAFIDAMTLVVRDGCDPHKVHAAMMGLDEYVDALPDDMLTRDLLAKRMEG